jgi:hypothetical protein
MHKENSLKNSNSTLEKLQRPEIVGPVDNLVLEAVRRLWWRMLERVCYCAVLIRCGSSTASMDRNRPHLPTYSAIQIMSGWSGHFR